MPTLLVIEDDNAVRRGVVDSLRFAGYEVIEAAHGNTGMQLALTATYGLLLLDLVLPGPSGFDILQALKQKRPGQPVIILSARGEENDRVRGLAMGADDYIVKPFSVRELLARVNAVSRRTSERPAAVAAWQFPGGTADFERHLICYADGTSRELAEREVDLLRYLVSCRGRPVSRDELLRQVWNLDPKHIETRTVDMHIAHLRQKLRDTEQAILRTIRGKGYVLETP